VGPLVTPELRPSQDRLRAVWEAPAPLFVYGSLLFSDVMKVLIDRDPQRTPALVRGWRIVAIPGRVYPGLVPDGDSAATGHLVADLTQPEWRILDAFESDFYDLVSVTTQTGVDAWAYALPDIGRGLSQTWDSAAFERDSLQRYLVACGQWRQSFGLGAD
jgi:gamma-glutamylcyclotransferase (GGCT)/AIG2-like uncharacterized protein YtfP